MLSFQDISSKWQLISVVFTVPMCKCCAVGKFVNRGQCKTSCSFSSSFLVLMYPHSAAWSVRGWPWILNVLWINTLLIFSGFIWRILHWNRELIFLSPVSLLLIAGKLFCMFKKCGWWNLHYNYLRKLSPHKFQAPLNSSGQQQNLFPFNHEFVPYFIHFCWLEGNFLHFGP